MSCEFIDGFDYYDTAHFFSKWTAGYAVSVVSGGRNGNCLSIPSGGGFASKTLSSQSAWVAAFAMKWGDGLPNVGGGWAVCCVWTSPFGNIFQPALCSMVLNPDRTLSLYANTTLMGYSNKFAIKTNTWYSFQIACSFSGDPIQTVASLIVNGQTVLSAVTGSTGLSIAGTTTQAAEANCHVWSPGNTVSFIDDVYIFNPSGAVNNGTAGDLKVGYTSAISDASIEWTPSSGSTSYPLINEVPPDDDTTYIISDTLYMPVGGAVDEFGFAPIAETEGNIVAAQINILARKDGAEGQRSVQGRLSGTAIGNEFSLNNLYQSYQTPIDDLDSVDAFNAATFGVELVA
jgi:hypothetical protein